MLPVTQNISVNIEKENYNLYETNREKNQNFKIVT